MEDDVQDFVLGTGLGFLYRNREQNSRGFSHGGVAIIFKNSVCNFIKLDFPNPSGFEVLGGVGTLRGHSRRMVVLACYLPPGYNAARGRACLDYITDLVIEVKTCYRQPYIVVVGDFNQWPIHEALGDYADITESTVGPTRGSRSIDRIFTSFGDCIRDSGTLPPLET